MKAEPSQEAIKKETEEIQKRWSERERRMRAGIHTPIRYTIPTNVKVNTERERYTE